MELELGEGGRVRLGLGWWWWLIIPCSTDYREADTCADSNAGPRVRGHGKDEKARVEMLAIVGK